MKRILIFIPILVAVCAWPSEQALAQRSQSKARQVSGFMPITESLNEEARSLPPYFRGHSIKAVSEAIYKQVQKKGEYETTAQHNRRVANIKNMLAGRLYGFQAAVPGDSFYVAKYDADSRTMTIKITNRYRSLGEGQDISIENFYTVERSIGTNAFGARVPIRTYYGSEFYITYNNRIDTEIRIDITPALAQKVRPNIRVLFVCKLVPDKKGDFLTGGPSWKEATIDSPTAKSVNQGFLHVRLMSIWVFNKATGEILKKQNEIVK